MDAVRRVRKVYVRHPNYGDLAQGLDVLGLDGLEDRVQVSVGTCTHSSSVDGHKGADQQEFLYLPCWDPSLGPSARYSLAWAICHSQRKLSWMDNGYRSMLAQQDLRVKTMVGADGSNRTTQKSGSGYLVGQYCSNLLIRS